MGRKRNPYIQLFTRDILSSPRCRALSESAAGVYLFLLCRLNEPPTPGAYRISDWELHPTWKRSKTQQCLAEPDKYERLQYFAAMLSKNDLPWKQSSILSGLQELYKYGIVVVEGDMLIQPRMYKDNRFGLPDLDNDDAPVNTILDDPTSGSMAPENDEEFIENKRDIKGTEKCTENGTEKVQQKVHVSHAPVTRALSVENMSNNIDNKGIDKGKDLKEKGVGKTKQSGAYKKKSDAKPVQKSANKPRSVADNPPTIEEIQAYFDERAAQGKPFVYVTPDSFYDACAQSGWRLKDGKPMVDWRARVRTFENYRREKGDPPVSQTRKQKSGEAVPATEPHKGKYKKW